MLLKARGIRKSFGGVVALTDVDLDVAAGEIVGIIGPNGAGKTSLLNILSGIVRPDAGSIMIGDVELFGVAPHRLAGMGVGRTFQNLGIFRSGTVLDNLMIGRHALTSAGVLGCALPLPSARREERQSRGSVREVLAFLGIEHLSERRVDTLPYGLQKRVELGRALVLKPELLLVDELVSGMNFEETADIARLVLTIRQTFGTAIVMIEHDLGMIMDLSDRIYVLNFGRLIASGTPDHISTNPEVVAAYFGSEHV